MVLQKKLILEELKNLRADSVEEMKNVRSESERKSKLLAEYQATPLEVVKLENIYDIVDYDSIYDELDSYLKPMRENESSMTELLNKISNRTTRIDNGLDTQYSLMEGGLQKIDSYITKPSRRKRFFESYGRIGSI